MDKDSVNLSTRILAGEHTKITIHTGCMLLDFLVTMTVVAAEENVGLESPAPAGRQVGQ